MIIYNHNIIDLKTQRGIRIPMSVSLLRKGETKKGNKCSVCDVIINDEIAQQIESEEQMKGFFLQICISYTII